MKQVPSIVVQFLLTLTIAGLGWYALAASVRIQAATPQKSTSPSSIPQPQPPQPQPQPTIDPQPEALRNKHRIVVVGDSITQSGGQYGGYVWLLQRYLNLLYPDKPVEIISSGVSGNTSTQLNERFKQDVLDKKPDLITINIGVNDVLQSFQTPTTARPNIPTTQEYQQNLTAMVQAATSKAIPVLLLSPTIIHEDLSSRENQRIAEYIAVMRDVAMQYRCQFIDLNIPFRHVIITYQRYGGQGQNLLTRDGIHPNIAGHQIIAYNILKSWGVPEPKIQSLKVSN
ncbi:SGNH/GDSL hydrolase family protein [Planktothrix agardhii 1806]|jgi:lysophospholipase L1-like esterase|uniref:SGNH/GDSL hydrolase family protein n=1 Tax=Planktothrix agardhii TaxID=1160 RepID=UPI001D0B3414|nr:SGNH/GDSL hydrolase family protein [Planktothrix agardhii]MCB8758331.1 SGNH/GDSL hydrolase family protein [Planktothrix agardhii 1813]MCF3572397.1 SGNH/GDSL hydrolase family protein [Planktothrix agardhii 1805]MCF3574121.1 SGNH/GDSL hydrolase family protein [Planktothrix agardhii 1812]MCF3582422.1 SGNH/GDSL hydrolase family protein [Planktothrix agardhii 1811]MCF3584516.1 SGNH/GDSL hydrolase family protein [Planktothrix agardhii 1803]